MQTTWDSLSDQPFLIDPEQDVGTLITSIEEKQLQSKEDYEWFLDSFYWAKVVTSIHERAGHQCEKCSATDHLQVHHIWYPPRGTEMNHLDALLLVCQSCHQEFHQ